MRTIHKLKSDAEKEVINYELVTMPNGNIQLLARSTVGNLHQTILELGNAKKLRYDDEDRPEGVEKSGYIKFFDNEFLDIIK